MNSCVSNLSMLNMLKQHKLSPFAIVLIFSIALGCLQSFRGPITFSDAIEHGQVLSGKVTYPTGNPIGLYYSKAYSLADHLSGAWLKVGFPESSLAGLLQALKGITLFAGLSLCTFALTAHVTWSVLSPIVWYTFGLWRFTDAYPITDIFHSNTNGFLGLAWAVLTLGLMANRRLLAGGFALGVLPYVHLSFGVFGWLLGALWYMAKRPKFTQLSGFLIGALVFAGSFVLHKYMFAYSYSAEPALAEYYFYFYTLLFDYHRQPLQATSVHTFVLLVIFFLAALYLFLSRKSAGRNTAAAIPIAAISVIAIAFCYSVIGSAAGLTAMPDIVLTLMPGRLANLALLLSGPLLFGLTSYLPSRVATIFAIVVTASAFVPKVVTGFGLASYGWDEPISVLIWFLALSVSLLLANFVIPAGEFRLCSVFFRTRSSRVNVLRVVAALLVPLLAGVIHVFTATTWFSTTLTLKAQHFVGFILLVVVFFLLMAVSTWRWNTVNQVSRSVLCGVGSLVAGPLIIVLTVSFLLGWKIEIPQLPGPRLAQVINLPAGQIIPTTDSSGMQLQSERPVLWFFDARTVLPYVPEAGAALEHLLEDVYGWHQLYDPSTWGISLKSIWERFSKEDWQRIAGQYAASTVAAPCDFRLALPLAYKSGSSCFYNLPNTSFATPRTFNTPDNLSTRYFFFPRIRWTSQGWHSLEIDSITYTHTWAWLEKSGQMGVYVSRGGDYYLRANIDPVGDQRVSIGLHGATAATLSYQLYARECTGSDFRFEALHLNPGFNVIDIKAEGQLGDVGAGRKASIAFKNIRWEIAEEVSSNRDNLGVGHCLPVIPPDAKGMSLELILGEWSYQGKTAKIAMADSTGRIVCTNEINTSIQVIIESEKLLLAKDWNAYATLSKDGKELRWNNGAIWTRLLSY